MSSFSRQAVARMKIITAMVAFGTIGVFVKAIPLESSVIAAYRAIIAALVLFGVVMFTGRYKMLKAMKKHILKLFIAGAAMGFNWVLLFEAYHYTSVALSTLSYYFAPTLIIIASSVFLKEKLTSKQILCFLGSSVGLIMIIGVAGGGSNDFIGVLYGLGAAFLYATVIMCNKMSGETDDITRTWLQITFAGVVIIPYALFTSEFSLAGVGTTGMVNLIIVGVVHTGIIYCLYFASLTELRGQQAAILSYIDPLVAVILSMLWLGERVSPIQLVGGGFILLFALLNEVKLRQNKPEKLPLTEHERE